MENITLVLIQTVGVIILLFLGTVIVGNRPISNATTFEFISFAAIAIIAGMLAVGAIPVEAGLVAIILWGAGLVAYSYALAKYPYFRQLVAGSETVIIKQGRVLEDNLAKSKMTPQMLLEKLRAKNIFNVADVEFAVLEPTGDVNALVKSEKKPLTPKHLGIQVAPQTEPQAVIIDGSVVDKGLRARGLTRSWLNEQLDKLGVTIDNVLLAQVDAYGELYVDLFDDQIKLPKPQVKEMLYATLKQAQASLVSFSLETDNLDAKKMYHEEAERLEKIIEDIKPYLLR
ncbi:uncharacterized membrane protein YcaP (DUF421 family) [Desulfitispora alkaliphila]|uniref:DUF421 domain-containing protein n=1 Tax=Desulfitispora alkaliphila TaxID=622674 RepID=UPI003D19A0F9